MHVAAHGPGVLPWVAPVVRQPVFLGFWLFVLFFFFFFGKKSIIRKIHSKTELESGMGRKKKITKQAAQLPNKLFKHGFLL